SKSERQRGNELEAEKNKIAAELNNVAAQLHIFRNAEVNEMAGFFANWYSKEGNLSVFCSDLEWLADASHKKVVDALRSKGNRLSLYLRNTNHPIAKKLTDNGANLFHIKPTVHSEHRFSTLVSGDVKSIIIRNKNAEQTGITFEEYQNQPGLVNLAQEMLEN